MDVVMKFIHDYSFAVKKGFFPLLTELFPLNATDFFNYVQDVLVGCCFKANPIFHPTETITQDNIPNAPKYLYK